MAGRMGGTRTRFVSLVEDSAGQLRLRNRNAIETQDIVKVYITF
jgi:hypothetical protein